MKELHEAWKLLFKLHGHSFIGKNVFDAEILAEAIDAHTLKTCLLVLKFSPYDGMVSGRTDEKGEKHESIGYIFGNQQTFARILRAATAAKSNGESIQDRFDRLANEVAS